MKRRHEKTATMDNRSLEALDPTRKKIERVRTFVRLPEPIKAEAKKRARTKKLSLNNLIVHALVEYLKK